MPRPRHRILPALIACCLPLAAAAGEARDLGHETLPANDGWAALPTAALPNGTTGGAAAAANRVHRVHDRNELVAALAFPDATPKIVEIEGTIDGNVDAAGRPLSCADYARPDPQTGELYSLPAFLAAYDPATWGRANPSGVQERARVASAGAQQARVRVRIPANTTIVGVGRGATVRGAWFDIRPGSTSGNQPMNVIVRNLNFEDTFDCFPQWSPTDGADGNWNSAYDAISVRNATHVWIDHNRFADVATADETLPTYFGRHFQMHDGLVDVTNESDLVTISWNRFENHDKVMLVGSSDSAAADRNKLRLTLHHNLFLDVGQRAPRVRYGRVHVYNNHYKVDSPAAASHYGYSWGVGIESQIFAQNNHFRTDDAILPAYFIDRLNGSRIHAEGTLHGGVSPNSAVDPLAAFNAAYGDTLVDNVDWAPSLHGTVEPSGRVPVSVIQGAGPFE